MNILVTIWTLYPRGFSSCHAVKFRAFIMPTYILVDTIKPAKVKCVYSKKKVPRYLPVHVH